MNVEDLVSELSQYPSEAEVRLAFQPSWPLEYGAGQVAAIHVGRDREIYYTVFGPMTADNIRELLDGHLIEDEEGRERNITYNEEIELQSILDDLPTVVYIGEGGQLGYLPGEASRELGWR